MKRIRFQVFEGFEGFDYICLMLKSNEMKFVHSFIRFDRRLTLYLPCPTLPCPTLPYSALLCPVPILYPFHILYRHDVRIVCLFPSFLFSFHEKQKQNKTKTNKKKIRYQLLPFRGTCVIIN
jgi:hypothetical protein